MLKPSFAMIAACIALSACGDPLRDVDRLSSVELAEDAVSVGALADPSDETSRGGFLGGLFGKKDTPAPSASDVAVAEALGEEGALTSPEAEAGAVAAAAAPAARERSGLFGFLRKKEQGTVPDVPDADVKLASLTEGGDTATPALPVPEAQKLADTTDAAPGAETRPRRGLFGLLSGARAREKQADPDATVQTASLGQVTEPVATPLATPNRRTRAHKGPDKQIVPYGTRLPAGAVARVCDLPSGRLGKEVGKFPERGRGYKIFDSDPRASGPRPFYITGFDDKCARTFTAALALFGSPTMHEQLRYGLPSKTIPYSTTDQAYEGIKRSICGVANKKPCGARIGQLEKDTAFVSIYDRIGSNSSWSNILLHKGWVLASDRKG